MLSDTEGESSPEIEHPGVALRGGEEVFGQWGVGRLFLPDLVGAKGIREAGNRGGWGPSVEGGCSGKGCGLWRSRLLLRPQPRRGGAGGSCQVQGQVIFLEGAQRAHALKVLAGL